MHGVGVPGGVPGHGGGHRLLPIGAAKPDGPRNGRWFGDQGPLGGHQGSMVLLGLLVVILLVLALTYVL